MSSWFRSWSGLFGGAAALSLLSPPFARADDMGRVDAAIVLAVDASSSIGPEEADRQRYGHADALRSREVQSAIHRGAAGCIAVAYVEWSSVERFRTVMPWRRICGRADAMGTADFIADHGDSGLGGFRRGDTSVSYAIEAGSAMLDHFPGQADSKIIDISANGTNNDGLPVEEARDRVLDKGQVINAIVVSRLGSGATDDLWTYFHDSVIGGPGSFTIVPDEPADYAKILRRKLVLEISRAGKGASNRHGS